MSYGPMRLQDRVLKAKQAIRAAGFHSGQFKPGGKSLRVDVVVPVTFHDFDKSQDELVDHLRAEIEAMVTGHPLSKPPEKEARPDCPYDLRSKEGKAWKKGMMTTFPHGTPA